MINYFECDGVWFTKDTDLKFAKFCVEAIKNRRRVRINYKNGFEDFSGYHGGDGLHHTMYIGKSTGTKPIALHICNNRSLGGEALLTCEKAIESYGYK